LGKRNAPPTTKAAFKPQQAPPAVRPSAVRSAFDQIATLEGSADSSTGISPQIHRAVLNRFANFKRKHGVSLSNFDAETGHSLGAKSLRHGRQLKGSQAERQAARQAVRQAKRQVRRSQPAVKSLSPAERSVVPLARKAHRKYPDVPVSVILAQDRQESDFNPAAISSAGAQGLSQFIPGTAASYGVKYGTGRKEQQSQVTGQAHYLHDLGYAKDPQAALSSYSGGYAASDYNNPVLEGAADYKALDKPGNPKALRRLHQAQVNARKLGLKVSGASSLGPAPRKVVTRFKAIKSAAAALTKSHIPYVWGGGHGSIESAPKGLDCSGAVSWVLAKAGILKTPLTSGSMGEVLKPGPGAVTVFYNANHTFMKIGNEYWGTSVGDSGSLGPHPAPSAGYLAQYSVGHVPGLGKKQALQLGFSPATSESFPGISLSSSGTTATIQPSAGTTQTKPGFSKSPIKLTPNQKAHRTLKKLAQLGAGVGPKAEASSEDKASILVGLERKYGKAAV
jgi:cell wall-associated NlpC family hydrolase